MMGLLFNVAREVATRPTLGRIFAETAVRAAAHAAGAAAVGGIIYAVKKSSQDDRRKIQYVVHAPHGNYIT